MDAKDEPKIEPDLTGQSLGEYVVLEFLGRGGQGMVWLCEQPALDRKLVVKLLAREGPSAKERFLREARLASRLDHPNAAHVYGSGFHEKFGLWIAMEHVAGVSLAVWLKANGRMTPDQFVPFFQAVVEVVAAAHAKGIIHRDLKPGNIMVIERDGRLVPKLLDFGIAREDVHPATIPDDGPEFSKISLGDASESVQDDPTQVDVATAPPAISQETKQDIAVRIKRITGEGLDMGTQGYMAPEQWGNARAVDQSADIYSVGVIAYECLRGKVPFSAATASELRAKHQVDRVPSVGPGFSPEVDQVIRQALAKEPHSRHRSVKEFGAALCSALRALPQGQLQSLAQVWDDAGRPASLLLRGGDLLHARGLIGLPKDFVTESNKAAVLRRRRRLFLVVALAVTVSAAGVTAVVSRLALKAERLEVKARVAEIVAETTVTQSEFEQGRSALLHNEPEAASHLSKAYQRAPKPMTSFMLARALQRELAEQLRFVSSVGQMWSASFSPDEKQVLTSDDKNARVWDVQSQRVLLTLVHGDTVFQAIYIANGAQIVTVCKDGVVRIWDARTGVLVRALRHGQRSLHYYGIAVSPGEKLVAAIDIGGAIAHVWNLRSGAELAELHGDSSAFPSVGFSGDGKWLAVSGGRDVRVFDVQTWGQAAKIPSARCMSWDPTGDRLVTGGTKGDVVLWQLPVGRVVHQLHGIGEAVTAVAYSPDGRLIVAASRDGTELVWNAQSGELSSQANYLQGPIRSVEFDRASELTVAASYGGSIAILDAKQGLPVSMLEGSRSLVATAHFDANSRRVLGASWDGTARIWNAAAPYRQWSSSPVASGCGVDMGLEPDRRILAIGCGDYPTHVWDTIDGRLLAKLPSVVAVDGDFSSALPAVSARGNRAAIARGPNVEVYALPGGQLVRTIPSGGMVNAVAFANAGEDLVSGGVDGSLVVTRGSGAQIVLPKSSAGIDAAGFLRDGRLLAADASRRLRVYDIGGSLLAELETSERVSAFRMSPDNRRLLTLPLRVGKATAPELWDLEHHRRVGALAAEGQGYVNGARFVAGSAILTASVDGAARLWDGATGELRRTYRGGKRFLSDAVLSPDGAMVVGGDAEGTLRFWDAASGIALWTMPAHRSALVGVYMEGENIVTRGFSGDISRWALPKPERVIEACSQNARCATVFP